MLLYKKIFKICKIIIKMRIVITRLGKNEIKEVDYEDIPNYNIINGKNNNNRRTISYERILKQKSIYNSNKTYKERKNNSLYQRIDYTLPSINKNNNNNTTFNKQNNKTSFLSKIGGLSIANQEFRTPKKARQNLQLPKNSANILTISNKEENNSFLNNEKNYKKVKINSKKLNIPISMLDKFSDFGKKNNNNLDEDSKINNTENSIGFDKMYYLRDILLPKNKKNIDDSFLDKQINLKGSESIINYLQSDKNISPSLIVKINKSNNEQLYKLDKVCQKYFNDEKIKNSLDNEIRQKIKKEYEMDSIFCKNNLNNMGDDLKNYNSVYKRLRLKKDYYENLKNIHK